MLQARADAQAALWFNDWEQAALDEDWVLTGKESTRAAADDAAKTAAEKATWAASSLAIAEATVTAKTTLETAALAEENAAKRW